MKPKKKQVSLRGFSVRAHPLAADREAMLLLMKGKTGAARAIVEKETRQDRLLSRRVAYLVETS